MKCSPLEGHNIIFVKEVRLCLQDAPKAPRRKLRRADENGSCRECIALAGPPRSVKPERRGELPLHFYGVKKSFDCGRKTEVNPQDLGATPSYSTIFEPLIGLLGDSARFLGGWGRANKVPQFVNGRAEIYPPLAKTSNSGTNKKFSRKRMARKHFGFWHFWTKSGCVIRGSGARLKHVGTVDTPACF